MAVSAGVKLKSATLTAVAEAFPLSPEDPHPAATAATRSAATGRASLVPGATALGDGRGRSAGLHDERDEIRDPGARVVVVGEPDLELVCAGGDVGVDDRRLDRRRVLPGDTELDGVLAVGSGVLRMIELAMVEREVQVALALHGRFPDLVGSKLEMRQLHAHDHGGADAGSFLGRDEPDLRPGSADALRSEGNV